MAIPLVAVANSMPRLLVPANERIWTLRMEGQAPDYLLFAPSDSHKGTFSGHGWKGTLSGREICLNKDGKTLVFDGGKPVGLGASTGSGVRSIEELWQNRPNQSGGIVGNIWSGHDRLKLFYENPNLTGAFLMSICLLGLGLLISTRNRILRIVSAGMLLLAFFLLVQTGSRGAFVGFCAGALGIVLSARIRIFNRRTCFAGLALLVVLITLVVCSRFGARFTRDLFERSSTNMPRVALAQAGLRMMFDNPAGWVGLCPDVASVGYAYCDWYKPLDQYKGWKTLLNSHLQILVYHGLALKISYVLVWLFGLAVLILRRQTTAVGVWVGFSATACFNDTLREWSLWIVPMGITLAGFCRGDWPRPKALVWVLAGSVCGTALILSALFWLGSRQSVPEGARFCAHGDRVLLNACDVEDVSRWVVDDDTVISGGFPGFAGCELRRICEGRYDLPALGYARSLDALPGHAVRIVVTGRKCREVLDRFAAGCLPRGFEGGPKEIVFLSPPFGWQAMPSAFVSRFRPVMVAGEFAAGLTDDGRRPPSWVRIVPAAELYIRNWIALCLQ